VGPVPPLPPPATLVLLDWLIVAVFLLGAVAAGLWGARRAGSTTENFFLSGRSLPWWLMGTSLVSTSFSSDTPLVVTGWTRDGGVAGNWRWWGYLVGTLLVVVLFSRLWRRSGVLTDVEFIELRYSGLPATVLRGFKALYQVVFVHCLVLGWVFLSMQKLLGTVLGLGSEPLLTLGGLGVTPAWLSLGACVLLTFLYCEASGLWGVVLTDFVQFPVAIAGAVTLAVCVVGHFGGLQPLVARVAEVDPSKLSSLPPDLSSLAASPSEWSASLWEFAVMCGLLWCANKNADGGGLVIQRILAAKDERHSLWGTLWFAVAHFALRPWPWILVALATLVLLPPVRVLAPAAGTVLQVEATRVLLQPDGGGAPLEVPLPVTGHDDFRVLPRVEPGSSVPAGALLAATDEEAAYPALMRRFLPAGLLGLMVASFLAAFMSAVDSHVNIAGSYLVNDVYRRFVRPAEPEQHYVRVARWVTPLVVVTAMVFAMTADSVRGLFNTFTTLFGGVGLAYVLRWTWWRMNAWSEVTVLATSVAMTLAVDAWPAAFAGALPPGLVAGGVPTVSGRLLLVFAASLVLVVPVTLLTPPVDREHLARFVERVRPLGAWGAVAPAGAWEPTGARTWLRLLVAWGGGILAVISLILLQAALFLRGGEGAGWWAAGAAAGLLLFVRALPSLAPGHRVGRP
jgi:Na+/proline symporter